MGFVVEAYGFRKSYQRILHFCKHGGDRPSEIKTLPRGGESSRLRKEENVKEVRRSDR
jgi:hypothetical protein